MTSPQMMLELVAHYDCMAQVFEHFFWPRLHGRSFLETLLATLALSVCSSVKINLRHTHTHTYTDRHTHTHIIWIS